MSLRRYRRARAGTSRSDPAAPTTPAGPPHEAVQPDSAVSATPAPTLSAPGRHELARLVATLGGAGLLVPRVPQPDELEEAVADWGEPVTVGAVLGALEETQYWRPTFRPGDHLAALAFHDSQVEQGSDAVTAQVGDLARLVADALDVRLAALEMREVGSVVSTRVRLVLGGQEHRLDYAGHVKRLSTVLHVTVARALRASSGTRPDRPRLAWLWTDQGVWLAVLRRGMTVEQLNAEVGDQAERWSWVDEEQPIAAGE
jgi:hypothetical protein